MYLITNRKMNSRAQGLATFGKEPNAKGPNELRLVQVEKTGKQWKIEAVKDRLSKKEVAQLNKDHGLELDTGEQWHGSLRVACNLFGQARKEKKSILFFVHGYNNDVEDVLTAAFEIQRLYKVIVVPFTWPANGGGLKGKAAYLSDKGDARVSAGALNRAIAKIHEMHHQLIRMTRGRLQRRARANHPDNRDAQEAEFTRLIQKECPVTLNLLCHSMGNYVFKHTLATSENSTSKLVFDNICLVAADTNNHDHSRWVGQLDVRKRVYIVINEDDYALFGSRIKPGAEQYARLGHYLKKLNSPNATYLDLTHTKGIDNKHTYFKGDAVKENAKIKALFGGMFNGKAIEDELIYRSDLNTYRLE